MLPFKVTLRIDSKAVPGAFGTSVKQNLRQYKCTVMDKAKKYRTYVFVPVHLPQNQIGV